MPRAENRAVNKPVRLQKYLSQAGVASRRKAEVLISAGEVRVNGVVVTELGTKVDPRSDAVEVRGERIHAARPVWIAVHKPAGYVTTRRDPEGRHTIYDLLPDSFDALFYVGRLDVNSEGLVLMTNQGDEANRLSHPRYEVDRVYRVDVKGHVTDAAIKRLLDGVRLEDGIARAQRVERLPSAAEAQTRLRLTLREGKNREVRRLLGRVGHPVVRLVRIRYGPIRLTELRSGEWRKLTREERAELEAITGA
jgi:23S rRNA pseudouridine2605 synthase